MKVRQQKELSESIIAKIQKELENPKVLQQILQQSVADVESKISQYIDQSKRLTNHLKQRSSNRRLNKWGMVWNARKISFVTTVYKTPVP